MSKKSVLPAKRAIKISFLPRVSRGKKHFYPSKCLSDDLRSYAKQRLRLMPYARSVFCRMAKDVRLGFAKPGDSFGGKVTLVTFSTVSSPLLKGG